MTATITIERKCLCGASLTTTSTPPDAAIEVDRLFDQIHDGEGHGPVPVNLSKRRAR